MEAVKIGPFGCKDSVSGKKFDHGGFYGITGLSIRHGGGIDSIVAYCINSDGTSSARPKVGGRGGDHTSHMLFDGQRIVEVRGHYRRFDDGRPIVGSLTFLTDRNITHGPFGRREGQSFGFKLSGAHVVGLFGTHGKYLSSIGFYIRSFGAAPKVSNPNKEIARKMQNLLLCSPQHIPRSPGPWGGEGGEPWDDGVFMGVKKIFIGKGCKAEDPLVWIMVIYATKEEGSFWSIHGGESGDAQTEMIKFNWPKEFLVRVSGCSMKRDGVEAINSLTFHTNTGKCVPVGAEIGRHFTTPVGVGESAIVGFFGKASAKNLVAIGVHLEYKHD